MKILIIFIISFIILMIAKLPISEAVLMAIGITFIYKIRVFWIFIILTVGLLLIYDMSIKSTVFIAGGIALVYWVGIILFTEHKSQTWMHTKEPWHLRNIERAHNRVTSNAYKDSAIDMFSGKRKRIKNINIEKQDENNINGE